jgi:hypothetical protein
MDTNDLSGGGDQGPDAIPEVPERPTPSGWVIVKKARKPRVTAAPRKTASTRKAAPVAKKRSSGKRELIDTGRNKMYAKRGAKGRFKEMDDVGRSLSADRRRTAKKTAKSGYGDQGDGRARGKKKTARKTARKAARKTARKTARKSAGTGARKRAR